MLGTYYVKESFPMSGYIMRKHSIFYKEGDYYKNSRLPHMSWYTLLPHCKNINKYCKLIKI